MTPATQILLFGKPFRIADYFRMGQIGWHWQIDDPNLLYRRRNLLTYSEDFSNAAWYKYNSASGAGKVLTLVADNSYVQSAPSGAATMLRSGLTVVFRCVITSSHTQTIRTGIGDSVDGSPLVQIPHALVAGVPKECVQTLLLNSNFGTSVCAQILGIAGSSVPGSTLTVNEAQLEVGNLPTTYQPVPTTWAQAYLDAVGAENIYAWTDTAGTIPNTAVGEGIGLLLGREYGGVRGVELVSPIDFTSGWTNTGTSGSITASGFSVSGTGGLYKSFLTVGKTYEVTINVTVSGSIFGLINAAGSSTPVLLNGSSSNGTGAYRGIFTATAAQLYFRLASAGTLTVNSITVREIPGTHLTQATGTAKPTLSARVNLLLNTATMSTQNVTTVATSYKLSFTGTGTVTLSGTSTAGPLVGTGANDRVSLTFTPTAGTLTLTVSGSVTLADLRTGDDAAKNIPAYQRVGATASDHDTDGFAHAAYTDGTDDSGTTATGGGNTTGFFYCGALTVSGGAGTARTIWSDTGTNTGYRVRINSSNKLELAAGNGSAYTTVQSNETITAPGTYLLSAWDDGGVLAVQVNNLAPATTTRPTVSAGTAVITVYKDNGAASSYFNGRDYGSVYAQRYIGETAHNRLKRYLANVARITV